MAMRSGQASFARYLLFAPAMLLVPSLWIEAQEPDVAALERRVAELSRELERARQELAAARAGVEPAPEEGLAPPSPTELEAPEPAAVDEALAPPEEPVRPKFTLGPVTIGGAARINYILGSYERTGDGPSRGGDGGNFELDTFRINMALEYEDLIGQLEYRWYDGYNFLHTGWLGYVFDDANQIQVGVTRVPFGPGPYGVSQSWFFDQHYYVGLADDMDLGVKYITQRGDWIVDLAYFPRSEGDWNGSSVDSARYSYDTVIWGSGLDADGNLVSADDNGYRERHQLNLRAIHSFDQSPVPTDLGVSLEYGRLDGKRADDGSHWAASVHMVNRFGDFMLASQLTRYGFEIDSDNSLGTDALIPMGAYDFAWPVAAKGWIPAVSLSYTYETPRLPWLDYVLPYVEYSRIVKTDDDFNDSELLILGAAWARGGWYIYTDLAFSNGNLFVGNEGDDYSNIFHGVGDFGVDGNDRWNYRFNINFGYYF